MQDIATRVFNPNRTEQFGCIQECYKMWAKSSGVTEVIHKSVGTQ